MEPFTSDRRGSATRWFAVAAGMLCLASVAGAHALDWLSQSGRVAMVAYRVPAAPARAAAGSDVDFTPTGSIRDTAVMIRLR